MLRERMLPLWNYPSDNKQLTYWQLEVNIECASKMQLYLVAEQGSYSR
jgi:hypothetical protein